MSLSYICVDTLRSSNKKNVNRSPSGLLAQSNCPPLGGENDCCHYSNDYPSHLIVKVHRTGANGILCPIWLELTLFIVRIKLWFHTSYLESFLNKAWYDRVMMVSLLQLLPTEAQNITLVL